MRGDKTIRTCKIKGKILRYDHLSSDKSFEKDFPKLDLEYLGQGDVHSINGKIQGGPKWSRYFWRNK